MKAKESPKEVSEFKCMFYLGKKRPELTQAHTEKLL